MKPTTSSFTIVKRNPYHFRLGKRDIETPKGVSKTVQDDSYSVKDIYEKFTAGLDLGISRQHYYTEDPDHDDPDQSKLSGLDLAEHQELLEATRERSRRNLELLKQMTPKPGKTADQESAGDDLRNDPEEPENHGGKKPGKSGGQKSTIPT